MSTPEYDPKSIDSVLATIIAELKEIRKDTSATRACAEDHEKRIGSIERWRTAIVGGALSIGVFGGWIATRIVDHVFK